MIESCYKQYLEETDTEDTEEARHAFAHGWDYCMGAMESFLTSIALENTHYDSIN